jgi:hypothetical protein
LKVILKNKALISKMSRKLILSHDEYEAMNAPRSSKSGKAIKPCHIIYEDVFIKDQNSLEKETK